MTKSESFPIVVSNVPDTAYMRLQMVEMLDYVQEQVLFESRGDLNFLPATDEIKLTLPLTDVDRQSHHLLQHPADSIIELILDARCYETKK